MIISVSYTHLIAAIAGLALTPADPVTGDNNTVSPDWLESAWKWRTPYVGSASAVGNITDSWYTLYLSLIHI